VLRLPGWRVLGVSPRTDGIGAALRQEVVDA
jgi:hypothetical protein